MCVDVVGVGSLFMNRFVVVVLVMLDSIGVMCFFVCGVN